MNNAKIINFREAFDYGWSIVKEKWDFLLKVWFMSFLVSLPFTVLSSLWESRWFEMGPNGERIATSQSTEEMFFYGAFQLLYMVIAIIIYYNTLRINLNILNKKEANVSDLFIFPTISTLRYIGAGIIYTILVLVGLIAFIVPGIYFAVKYIYVFNLIAEYEMTIKEAAEKSAKMVEGKYLSLLGYGITMFAACLGIVVAGLICLVVGVIPAAFIAGWISTFGGLSIYKKLKA